MSEVISHSPHIQYEYMHCINRKTSTTSNTQQFTDSLFITFIMSLCFYITACSSALCYLNMKMKSMRSIQKVATLSMVFISTTSCRLSAGMNLTSLMTLSSRNVLSTDRPPSAWPMISHTLGREWKQIHMYISMQTRKFGICKEIKNINIGNMKKRGKE